ncbi:transposase [Rheinheimera salexigens]|uniref:transposase n=2 Tax=Rheinheimera salexigens TaxID=1628148 RepID=UPI0039EEDDCA
MARKPRFYVKGVPCHVVQRGNNRQRCFLSDEDFGFYMRRLEDALQCYQVQLHAFVLMTNHVHLLMTPQDSEGISRVLQSVGRDYVRYFNNTYQRSGTLWEGRHKASLIDSERYFMLCMRYIELNPVRARMVKLPEEYHWSSFQQHGVGNDIASLTPHPLYLGLADNAQNRCSAYRALFTQHLTAEEIDKVRRCVRHNYPLADARFRAELEQRLGCEFGQLGPGRPLTIN